jgi:hypothetical protein
MDNGAADNRTLGEFADRRKLRRSRDSEAHRHRKLGETPYAFNQ